MGWLHMRRSRARARVDLSRRKGSAGCIRICLACLACPQPLGGSLACAGLVGLPIAAAPERIRPCVGVQNYVLWRVIKVKGGPLSAEVAVASSVVSSLHACTSCAGVKSPLPDTAALPNCCASPLLRLGLGTLAKSPSHARACFGPRTPEGKAPPRSGIANHPPSPTSTAACPFSTAISVSVAIRPRARSRCTTQ